MTDTATRADPPLSQVGAWLMLAGAAGLGLGLSGLVMIFALPAIGLDWYGGLLVLLGLVQSVEMARHLSATSRTIRGALALVYVGCGVALMLAPDNVGALELLIAVLFTAAGAFRIVWSITWPHWPKLWGVAAGIGSIVLGLVMLSGWPTGALWVLGAAVAFDLAVYGISAILFGWALRR